MCSNKLDFESNFKHEAAKAYCQNLRENRKFAFYLLVFLMLS